MGFATLFRGLGLILFGFEFGWVYVVWICHFGVLELCSLISLCWWLVVELGF